MILAFDIGNSVITFGGFEEDGLRFVASMSADTRATADEYEVKIRSILALKGVAPESVCGAAVASVRPPLNGVIKQAVKGICGVEPTVVGPGVKTGIGIRCDLPSSVGADIICACVAADALYGFPSLIIDLDTAVKMTAVDSTGAFVGTSIAPGITMGLDALSDGAVLLPKVELSKPAGVIAKNTADCMRSGVIYGSAAMVDGMIDRIFEELGSEQRVIVTGPEAELILPFCRHEVIYDGHLVLKGLNIIYRKNN